VTPESRGRVVLESISLGWVTELLASTRAKIAAVSALAAALLATALLLPFPEARKVVDPYRGEIQLLLALACVLLACCGIAWIWLQGSRIVGEVLEEDRQREEFDQLLADLTPLERSLLLEFAYRDERTRLLPSRNGIVQSLANRGHIRPIDPAAPTMDPHAMFVVADDDLWVYLLERVARERGGSPG
jgi:hypothetical protein